jgi:hypothetical protein
VQRLIGGMGLMVFLQLRFTTRKRKRGQEYLRGMAQHEHVWCILAVLFVWRLVQTRGRLLARFMQEQMEMPAASEIHLRPRLSATNLTNIPGLRSPSSLQSTTRPRLSRRYQQSMQVIMHIGRF